MFAFLWGAQMWRPEEDKNICHRVLLINSYLSTYSDTRIAQNAKSQRISHCFNLRDIILGRHFSIVSRKSLEIQPCFITRRNLKFEKR